MKFSKLACLMLAALIASAYAQNATADDSAAPADDDGALDVTAYDDGEYDVTMNAAGCYVLTGTMLLVVICENEEGADQVLEVDGKQYSWVNGTVTNMSPTNGVCNFALDSLDVDLATGALQAVPANLPITETITLAPAQILKFAFLLPYVDGAAFVGVTDEMRSCPLLTATTTQTTTKDTTATTPTATSATTSATTQSTVTDTGASSGSVPTAASAAAAAVAQKAADTAATAAATPPPTIARTPKPTEEAAKATTTVIDSPETSKEAQDQATVKTSTSPAPTMSKSTLLMLFSGLVAVALPLFC